MAGKTTYKPEYDEQANKITSMFGANDKELAKYFGVSDRTINRWKVENESFCQSIKDGKDNFDTNRVENALLQRCLGYEHEDTYFSNYKGKITATPYIKHYAPDVTALIFWLVNRSSRWEHINRERSTNPEEFNDILKELASASHQSDFGKSQIRQ